MPMVSITDAMGNTVTVDDDGSHLDTVVAKARELLAPDDQRKNGPAA